MGIPYRSVKSHVLEEHKDRDPRIAACFLAEKKAMQVSTMTDEGWILGADTMVVIGDKVLGKPSDPEEARQMLYLLSGQEHLVITGFCLLNPKGEVAHSEAVITRVRIKKLTPAEIDGYVGTEEPFGKAGSYAIQGIGAFMVESISGSYTNVVGLPVCAMIRALVSTNALTRFPLTP
jgi:septum formation protein